MEPAKGRIAYWVYNYSPRWEASSTELEKLFKSTGKHFSVCLISQNFNNKTLAIKGKKKRLPFPLFFCAVPLYRKIAASFNVNHIFSSLTEPLLVPRISHLNTIATITKDSDSLAKFERNIPHFKKMKYVVVESERHREILKQSGLNADAIKLIYPGVGIRPYEKARLPFKILFATSPLGKFGLLSRGIYLLLQTAAVLPDVQFILVWREKNHDAVKALVDRNRLGNVEIRNGFIPDMDRVYRSVHATILPGLTHSSLKPCPHSALDSLANGKPVLVSHPTSIADLVLRNHCGVGFEPSVDSLTAAIRYLRDHYDGIQRNCHRTVESHFSEAVFIERYRRIYDTMLQDVPS